MKKTLLSIAISVIALSISIAQNQKMSIALDSNSVCTKATKMTASYTYSPITDNFNNKGNNAYFTFTATNKSVKIKAQSLNPNSGSISIELDSACSKYLLFDKGNSSYTMPYAKLVIGKNYTSVISSTNPTSFQTGVINIKKDDDLADNPTVLIENTAYNFNISDYTKGRDRLYGTSCTTTKADSNTVDIFFKFKATSATETLVVSLDNPKLETVAEMTTTSICKNDLQTGQSQRFYTFSGLTIGTDYTVRVEFGSSTPLGYARTAVAASSNIVLKSGVVTFIEDIEYTYDFSIKPNPNKGSFTFTSNNKGNSNLEVYNILGQKVALQYNVSNNDVISFPLSTGVYLLNISNEQGSKTEKLVIE